MIYNRPLWSYVQGTVKTLVLDEAAETHDFSV